MDNSIPSVNRSHSYQLTMRAIGQVLDWLHVRSFEIEASGKDFTVHGLSEKSAHETTFKAVGFKTLVKIFRPNQALPHERQPAKKAPPPFAFSGMRFSHVDLDRLQLRGHASRLKSGDIPTFNTWSHALRALGAHLDHKRASIIRVSGCEDLITTAYKLPFGAEKLETFNRINLYDLWVHMFKRRRIEVPLRKSPIRRRA